MALTSKITTNINPATLFILQANRLPGQMRKAMGEAGSELYKRRTELLKETIYDRGPSRDFTNEMLNSEYIRMQGASVYLGNKAPYAQIRGEDMSGTSRMGYDLESKYASTAAEDTKEKREDILRSALNAALGV